MRCPPPILCAVPIEEAGDMTVVVLVEDVASERGAKMPFNCRRQFAGSNFTFGDLTLFKLIEGVAHRDSQTLDGVWF